MFEIYANDILIFDDKVSHDNLIDVTLNLEINRAGSLEFSLYKENPYYDNFERMRTIVKVLRDGELIFSGRVLSTEIDIFGCKKVTSEGEMAYFNDSFIRPFGYKDDGGSTQFSPSELFQKVITVHNSTVKNDFRSFRLGLISISNHDVPVDWNQDSYKKSSDFISELVENFGGYIQFRHEDNGTFIDWLGTLPESTQTVEFGENILELNHSASAEDMITAILPYGEKNENTGFPTDISEMELEESEYVKKENDYIYNKKLFSMYGLIIEARKYEGYPADWISKAVSDVQSLNGITHTLEISAIDLSVINKSIDHFMIGTRVHVISERHSIDEFMVVDKLKLDILDPSKSNLTFGSEYTVIDSINDIATDLRSEDDKLKAQTQADIDFIKDELNDTNVAISALAEKGQQIGVSFTASVRQARIYQPEGLNWAYFKTTSLTIRINCNSTINYPTQITVNETLTDKTGYYAVVRVVEDGMEFYRPIFLKRILDGTGIKWYRINDTSLSVPYHDDVYIIGSFSILDGTAKLWGVARTVDEAGAEAFMEYLSTANNVSDEEFANYCKRTGVENIFNKLAVLEAFVNRLFANELTMTGIANLKSSNFMEAFDSNTNSYYPKAGYRFKATPDERGVQCSLYNARMSILKAIDAEFWKTTLHGIVDHDHFKTTSAGSGIASMSFSEGSPLYYETEILTKLTDLCKNYGESGGIWDQVLDGLTYTLNVSGEYHGVSFTQAVWHESYGNSIGVINGKLHFFIPTSTYTLKSLRTYFSYGSESMDSNTMTTYYEVTNEIWNAVSVIPENNVCDSVTGTITVGDVTLTASTSDPIRIVNTGSTVTFTQLNASVSISEKSYYPTAIHASGISTPTTWDGIEVKNILPRDTNNRYSIGTKSKKFTVWGAVFN